MRRGRAPRPPGRGRDARMQACTSPPPGPLWTTVVRSVTAICKGLSPSGEPCSALWEESAGPCGERSWRGPLLPTNTQRRRTPVLSGPEDFATHQPPGGPDGEDLFPTEGLWERAPGQATCMSETWPILSKDSAAPVAESVGRAQCPALPTAAREPPNSTGTPTDGGRTGPAVPGVAGTRTAPPPSSPLLTLAWAQGKEPGKEPKTAVGRPQVTRITLRPWEGPGVRGWLAALQPGASPPGVGTVSGGRPGRAGGALSSGWPFPSRGSGPPGPGTCPSLRAAGGVRARVRARGAG